MITLKGKKTKSVRVVVPVLMSPEQHVKIKGWCQKKRVSMIQLFLGAALSIVNGEIKTEVK